MCGNIVRISLYSITSFAGTLEKIGVEPYIQRIGKYKSAGDLFSRKNMSNEVSEMLNSLLDDIYGNWLDTISSAQGALSHIF